MTAVTETLEVPTLPLHQLRTHPANPRRDAVADAEMVDSIRAQGINEPIMVAPAPDGVDWYVIDGHRRLSGAQQAGLDTVPVNPRYDLATEAQQVEVMIVTGLQKQLLTPVEEAAAYEQLALHGMDEAAICAATGFGKARVRSRMRLNTLPETALGQVHGGEMTLADAEALYEFEDDVDATAALLAAIGTSNFRYQLSVQRSNRERRAKHEETIAGFVDLGAVDAGPEADANELPLWRFQSTDLRGHDAHTATECLGYRRGGPSSYSGPYLVCLDRTLHDDAAQPTAGADASDTRDAEWKRQQEAREAKRADQAAAVTARTEWLVDHLTACFPARGNAPLAAFARGLLPTLVRNENEIVPDVALRTALGLTTQAPVNPAEHESTTDQAAKFANDIGTTTTTKVLRAFAGYLAAMVVEQLGTDPAWLDDPDEIRQHLELWDWASGAGYPMCDVDVEDRAQLESKLLEVTDQEQG